MKCHMKSEGHLRQMRVFAENPNSIIDDFSKDFERGFLDTLSHRHGTKRILANAVYKEYIGDKHHIHMNSTCWTSLTGFVKYLGKEGKVVVDETEKGWYISWIDRDPKMIARQAAAAQRQQQELDDEEKAARQINLQIAAIRKCSDGSLDENNLNDDDDNEEEEEGDSEEYDDDDDVDGDDDDDDDGNQPEDEDLAAERKAKRAFRALKKIKHSYELIR